MRINSESFGAESSLFTWLDAEIPRFKEYHYLFRAFPGIRVAESAGFFREGGVDGWLLLVGRYESGTECE